MSEESIRSRLPGDAATLAAILLIGIAGTGLVRRYLGEIGLNGIGRIVYILGYGGTIAAIWYGWIRPLDITGPQGNSELREEERPDDGDDSDGG